MTQSDMFDNNFGQGCVVRGKPVPGGFFDSPKAILYRRKEYGPRHSISAHPVLVHQACEPDGRSRAADQGYGWQYPPAPEWDDPNTEWVPPAPRA